MNRISRAVLVASTICSAWLGMQATHEFGHVVGALLTGGQVQRVVLNPLTISRTDLSRNPRPLLVVWAGPLIGSIVPLLLWQGAVAAHLSGCFVLRFFAGFCLVANGLYIAVGSFGRVGDCGEMLRHGSYIWHLWLFGLATVPAGIWLWNGQGRHFGFGANAEPVTPRITTGALIVAITLLTFAFWVGGE